MAENILSDISEDVFLEDLPGEIVEEVPTGEIVEEMPEGNENEIVEELPEETFDDTETITEEIPQILSDDILLEENENELHEEKPESETNNDAGMDNEETSETDQNSSEEEILSYIETLTASSEVIQYNCKTGIENLQLISTCSLALQSMILGGVVIFCYLNRLG